MEYCCRCVCWGTAEWHQQELLWDISSGQKQNPVFQKFCSIFNLLSHTHIHTQAEHHLSLSSSKLNNFTWSHALSRASYTNSFKTTLAIFLSTSKKNCHGLTLSVLWGHSICMESTITKREEEKEAEVSTLLLLKHYLAVYTF